MQTFRRENDRFWILAAHPEQNLLVRLFLFMFMFMFMFYSLALFIDWWPPRVVALALVDWFDWVGGGWLVGCCALFCFRRAPRAESPGAFLCLSLLLFVIGRGSLCVRFFGGSLLLYEIDCIGCGVVCV